MPRLKPETAAALALFAGAAALTVTFAPSGRGAFDRSQPAAVSPAPGARAGIAAHHPSLRPSARPSGSHPSPRPSDKAAAKPVEPEQPQVARAALRGPKGERLGVVEIAEMKDGGVRISVRAKGLEPGFHGIHLHESGQCVGPDFKSAGGHFNPGQAEHGLKNPRGAHAGDLPNLEVKEDGTASAMFRLEGVKLKSGPHPLLSTGGTSIVVNEKADDQMSNPAGESGDGIACGVIRAKPSAILPMG